MSPLFSFLLTSLYKRDNFIFCILENTRNRYSWICSLQSKNPSPKHYCAMTLLSRPPTPTVLVGSAHCTDLCKSSRGEVENCCCGGPNDCSDNIVRCGTQPKVVEMTGSDAEILCGEWDTSDTPPSQTGERYNIILNIREIIKHPNYEVNADSSAYILNDIAIFKVDETALSKVKHLTFNLWNRCLTLSKRSLNKIIIGHIDSLWHFSCMSPNQAKKFKGWSSFGLVKSNTIPYTLKLCSWLYKNIQRLLQTKSHCNGNISEVQGFHDSGHYWRICSVSNEYLLSTRKVKYILELTLNFKTVNKGN